MIAPASAYAALEALWQVMVELAEAANAEIARSASILARLATTP
ncbi:MAG: hypothetical protein ABL932_01410 [Terricaulis sp.]